MKREDLRGLILAKYNTLKNFDDDTGIDQRNIENWHKGITIPPIEYMPILSNKLGIKLEELIDAFSPYKMKDYFYSIQSYEDFVSFAMKYSSGTIMINYEHQTYKVDKMIVSKDDILFYDIHHNYILFSADLISNIVPLNTEFDIFTFILDILYPVFLSNDNFIPEDFRQSITITFAP